MPPFALVILALTACLPPEGSTPDAPGGTGGAAVPGTSPVRPDLSLAPLPFPRSPPTDAWTRTSPATMVNEQGAQVFVIDGHHTRVRVQRLLPERAFVTCTGCRSPVEGWLQRSVLLPEGYEGTTDEHGSADLSLALFVASARRIAVAGGAPPGLPEPPQDVDTFTALLDRGFAMDRTRAWAPPWGLEAGHAASFAQLVRETRGWRFVDLRLVADP